MKRFISSYFKLLRFETFSMTKALFFSLSIFYCCGVSLSALSRELPQESELYQTLPGESDKGSILDSANPMDLRNRLRRATAMKNATDPSDAIDDALEALEGNELIPSN